MSHDEASDDVLPLVALRDMVMFPGVIARLAIGRPRSVAALQKAVGGDGRLVLVAQRDRSVDEPTPDDLYDVGVVSTVRVAAERPDGRTRIVVVNGLERCRIVAYVQQDPYVAVRVELSPSPPETVPADLQERVGDLMRTDEAGRRVMLLFDSLPETVPLDYVIAFGLDLSVGDKQQLLAEPSRVERYRMLVPALEVEAQIARASRRIRTRYAPTRRQRRDYLEERKRDVERELGELTGEGADIGQLRERLEQADLPPEALKEAERELDRLSRMPAGSPEYGVAEGFLDCLLSLPWHEATDAVVDLEEARRILDRDHYDREEVKERILEFLSVRKLRPEHQGALLCLVGAPGVGKTSLGRSIAEATRRKFHRISLGGTRDEAEIRGHRRTYVGALPGRIIRALRTVGVRNPIIQLDEVDKLARGPLGDPTSALLEVLDPEQNVAFVDSYLSVPFDLSQVMFIGTANTVATIPPALLDRMEVIELPGYITEEKVAIASQYLVPKQLEAKGLDAARVEFDADAIELLVEGYTREAGVRGLERQIASVCRKMAREYISGRCCYRCVDAPLVVDLLGPALYHPERGERSGKSGVCPTMAISDAGAELLLVEVLKVDGTGKLMVTGRVGEVLRESATLVYSFWKSSCPALGFDPASFETSDFHIHFPGGRRPTEGTSAGLPMALAFASALSGVRVPDATAALGEVTLRGRVLPVDGLRDRLAAAQRAGIEHLLLPEANRPEIVVARRAGKAPRLEVTFVDSVQQAVEIALPAACKAASGSRR